MDVCEHLAFKGHEAKRRKAQKKELSGTIAMTLRTWLGHVPLTGAVDPAQKHEMPGSEGGCSGSCARLSLTQVQVAALARDPAQSRYPTSRTATPAPQVNTLRKRIPPGGELDITVRLGDGAFLTLPGSRPKPFSTVGRIRTTDGPSVVRDDHQRPAGGARMVGLPRPTNPADHSLPSPSPHSDGPSATCSLRSALGWIIRALPRTDKASGVSD